MSADESGDILRHVTDVINCCTARGDPVLCPQVIREVAACFGLSLVSHPNTTSIVRIIKNYLRRLGTGLRASDEFIAILNEHLSAETQKLRCNNVPDSLNGLISPEVMLGHLASGSATCSHCEKARATVVCRDCHDFFCRMCFHRLHGKGRRYNHRTRCVQLCECGIRAVVKCPLTEKIFCSSCYTNNYLPTIPLGIRQNPIRIDYFAAWNQDIESSNITAEMAELDMADDWIPFIDRDGVLFYYNFKTSESQRRSPLEMFADERPIPDEKSDVSVKLENRAPLTFISPFRH
jgi:hypothetical protein